MIPIPHLLPQIGFDLQGIVDSVDQIGQGNHHRQLNNFIFGIIFAHIFQNRGIDSGSTARNNIGKANGDFFFFVKSLAAPVKPQFLYLFVGNAGLLRRSGVGEDSVPAFIDDGCFQIGQLLVFGLYFTFAQDRVIKL